MRKPKQENLVRARRVLTLRRPEPLPAAHSRTAESARALTLFATTPRCALGTPPLSEWPTEHCANEPQPFLYRLTGGSISMAAPFVAMAVLCLFGLPAYCAVHQVESVGITVNDLALEVHFFTQVLPFEEVSRAEIKGQAADDLLGLQPADLKVACLRLGNENIILTEHKTKGRPVPLDS